MAKRKRYNMKLNPDDHYFLNNLKNRRQWLESDDEFIGTVSEDEWYMLSDYMFRLSKDYTAYVNNKQMHEPKKEERVADVKRCAESILKMAGIQPKGGQDGISTTTGSSNDPKTNTK